MNATQRERADDLVDAFELFDQWEDRYRFLIDLGRKIPPLDDSEKTEENRVHGCQSNVWMVAKVRPEGATRVIDFVADSDSAIVKGLIAVLQSVCSGQPAADVLSFDVNHLLERLELDQHLSMGRRNGLHGMIQRIRQLAAAHVFEAVPA